jgi:hypothetical protein
MQGGHVFPRTIDPDFRVRALERFHQCRSGFWVLGSGFWVLGFGILGEPRERNLKPLWLSLRLRMPRLECGKSGGGGLEFWKVSAGWSSHRLTFVALAAGGWWLVAGRTVWLVKIFSTDLLRLDANF